MNLLYNSSVPILIKGESGTGKTILARKIHTNSNRKELPFVKCDVAGLSDNLFSSELFGHEKGAFTGADKYKQGYCDIVGDGTLFLDEIGELSLIQQKRLLSLLDESMYSAVGSYKRKRFYGRVIFATHRDLEEMVRNGKFREDLYFRMGVNPIQLKPFWRRAYKEKQMIIQRKINEVCDTYNLNGCEVSNEALLILTSYEWPGNFREIEKTIEFLILKGNGSKIEKSSLPPHMTQVSREGGLFRSQVELFESKIILKELASNNHGVNKTSKSLGISKTTLIAKMRKYGITVHQFKESIKIAA
ncbi:sigma 54-interacting transcriptional regulator [Halobacteriovorax sp. HLS]|uniref:sigma 54-interacting transcriptional regulator n=1 Tax=Halobacteriovorax sp. HLS TaxID=2234000 RepID=UPI000FDBAA17|nr:sigma 54-interacting transcriptional regulator [Halobacteriovorax sp. HLS]